MNIKTKNTIKYSISILLLFFVFGSSFAQYGKRGNRGSDPIEIFEQTVDKGNTSPNYKIQDTALDRVSDDGSYEKGYKVSNTLTNVRTNVNVYLQRAIYVGMVLATVALIYIGFLLVTHAVHNEGDWTKVKGKILNTVIGVFILSGFYFFIKLMVALINALFGST